MAKRGLVVLGLLSALDQRLAVFAGDSTAVIVPGKTETISISNAVERFVVGIVLAGETREDLAGVSKVKVSDDGGTVLATWNGDKFALLATQGAAGKVCKVTVTYDVQPMVKTRVGRRYEWTQRGQAVQRTLSFTAVVAIGDLGTTYVGVGSRAQVSLPSEITAGKLKMDSTSIADISGEGLGTLEFRGKKVGKTRARVKYKLAGKELEAQGVVEVVEKELTFDIRVAPEGRTAVLSSDVIKRGELQAGKFLQVLRSSNSRVAIGRVENGDLGITGKGEGSAVVEAIYEGKGAAVSKLKVICKVTVTAPAEE